MSKQSKSKIESAGQVTKDTARQLWMAGLGAFVKTGQEGGRLFSTLVEEGEQFQDKMSQKAADNLSDKVDSAKDKASGQWDKLEVILEERVIKVLDKLGVPSKEDIAELIAKIDALEAALKKPKSKPRAPRRAKKAEAEPAE